ncbi:uncharacterized protein LOC128737870 [Sabethes cyaneus]|uniref:uncharacterized protein LOC128737870 n=1 Tax=Sabethes cyaneus TaxID=53552 RepID=UPI00237DF464|nr:uncharacterized protein LOC128737870 [Sabethes cyaneus]
MSDNCIQSNNAEEQLDDDLAGMLTETQGLFQNFIKTQRELKASQLEARLSMNELNTLRQRIKSDEINDPSDWKQFSLSLDSILKTISDRKDIKEYEQIIVKLTEENTNMKQQLIHSNVQYTKQLDEAINKLKEEYGREKAQYTKQVSELMIHKELAASEASIRYDQLQFKLEHVQQDSEQRYNSMVSQYENLLQTLSEQKQKLRDENAALQKREENLLEKLNHIQNHSTDYLLGLGKLATPVEGSKRYSEVVQIIPRASSSNQRPVQHRAEKAIGPQVDITQQRSIIELAEASSSSSSTNRPAHRNRASTPDSPQHPGSGAHIAKPRKKRKLLNQSTGAN